MGDVSGGGGSGVKGGLGVEAKARGWSIEEVLPPPGGGAPSGGHHHHKPPLHSHKSSAYSPPPPCNNHQTLTDISTDTNGYECIFIS